MDTKNAPSQPAANAPRVIQSLTLPQFGDAKPGPLHTIVTDPERNIYYSDEINHSVVSLTGGGTVRWHRTQKGSGPGEFYYPRGLSLGRIQLNGEAVPCLAVADAWNRRVQFLDLDGNVLAIWTHGGEIPFGEVADVRFIREIEKPGEEESPSGFWYVLDRGNHRLCRFGAEGNIVDQIGRGFPRYLEIRWAVPEIFFREAWDEFRFPERFSAYDFTFYPERILGISLEALFVCDADSRRLKLVRPPYLLPLCLDAGENLEWIAADQSGVLAWDRASKLLQRRKGSHGEYKQVKIDGEPIASNLSSREFWMQTNDSVRRWKWDVSADHSPNPDQSIVPSLVTLTAARQIERLDITRAQTAADGCLSLIDEELGLADNLLAMGERDIDQQLLDGMSVHLEAYKVKCSRATQHIREAFHDWCLGQLGFHIIGKASEEVPGRLREIESIRSSLGIQIRKRIGQLQERVDGLNSRISESRAMGTENPLRLDSWRKVASMAGSGLEYAKEWIASWSGITEVPTRPRNWESGAPVGR